MAKRVTNDAREAAVRGLKEAARVGLVAAVVAASASLQAGKVEWRTVVLGALVAAYNGASKYVATNPDISLKGLYPW